MNDQLGDDQSQSPQSRYYDRYLKDTDPHLRRDERKRRKGLVAGGVASAALLGAAAVFALTRAGDAPDNAAGSSATAGSTSASTRSDPPTSSTPTTSAATSTPFDVQSAAAQEYGPALKSGWTIVRGKSERQAAYDVPTNDRWEPPKNSSDMQGWMSDNDSDKSLVTTAPSQYGKGFCATDKSQGTGFVGLVNIGTRDPAEAAPAVLDVVAKLITYNKDSKTYAKKGEVQTRQIKVNGGTIDAIESKATMENGLPEQKRCSGKNYEARTVAFSGKQVSVMLLIFRNLDATDKMPDQDIDGIINSLRPKK